ncbi:uncharacterized protein BYT42DRAFT_615899 [Radiomyces spectabilis]|uniref:uncharacterized protein n=1 Tax=Radiomyces spectabilis TaxID=64574 RepID=UPI00221FE5B1|nr:uncharacterized protein BYT42DRAFT_615899 [Radiomyces spectabilis]KAI8372684.1 hypothetical protein BYT42DRAFT_615899 [Radiomyces spectabilis]
MLASTLAIGYDATSFQEEESVPTMFSAPSASQNAVPEEEFDLGEDRTSCDEQALPPDSTTSLMDNTAASTGHTPDAGTKKRGIQDRKGVISRKRGRPSKNASAGQSTEPSRSRRRGRSRRN